MARSSKYILDISAGASTQRFRVGDREFRADPMTVAEAFTIEQSIVDADEDATRASLVSALNDRRVDGEPIDGDWLLASVTKVQLRDLMSFLINGEVRDPN